jgi:Putative zinc-finger
MRELKYEAVGGGSSGHLELEEIAAYLDGRLSEAEQGGITRHLSVCEECLELFTETAHALRETDAETAGGYVVPFVRPSRHSRQWLPYAAAATVLLALAVPRYLLLWAPREMEVAEVLEPLMSTRDLARARAELAQARADLGRARVIWEGTTYRSGEEPETDAPRALSFLVGAHLVGFQEAVKVGDPIAAGEAGRRVANYLSQGYFLDAEKERFRKAVTALEEQGAPTSRYAGLIEETSEAIDDSFAGPSYELGKWAQAGYIASRIGNRVWFERRANRRFLSYLLRQDEEPIEPEARAALERIREVWDRGELRPAELAGLAGQFEAILQRYQVLSEEDTLSGEG